jgi:hypothetical protein
MEPVFSWRKHPGQGQPGLSSRLQKPRPSGTWVEGRGEVTRDKGRGEVGYQIAMGGGASTRSLGQGRERFGKVWERKEKESQIGLPAWFSVHSRARREKRIKIKSTYQFKVSELWFLTKWSSHKSIRGSYYLAATQKVWHQRAGPSQVAHKPGLYTLAAC